MTNKINDDLLMRKMAGRRPALSRLNSDLKAIKENNLHILQNNNNEESCFITKSITVEKKSLQFFFAQVDIKS